MTTSTPFIDWHALVQVLLTSAVAGVGIVALFSIGVYSLSILGRKGSSLSTRAVNALIMGFAMLAIAGTVAWGFYIIVHK